MRSLGKFGIFLLLTGCYVNRAVIDPYSYAPAGSACVWIPDEKGAALADECPEPTEDLPEKHVYSLAEILDIALFNSPKTQKTWAEARISAAKYAQTQANAFPDIEAGFNLTHSRTSFLASQVNTDVDEEELINSSQTISRPYFKLSYTLFDFGQRRATSLAARYLLYFADFTHNREIQSLLDSVTKSYYNTLYNEQSVFAREADLADAYETLKAAELGLQEGVKDVSDVLEATNKYLQAEIQLTKEKKNLHTARAELLDTLGLPACREIILSQMPKVDYEDADLPCLDAYIECAMRSRPDLLALRARMASKEQKLKAARSEFFPHLDYSIDFGKSFFSGGFQNDYDYVSTLSVSMPIFKGFWNRNNVKLASAEIEQACAEKKGLELKVIEEVTTAHYNVSAAEETLKSTIGLLKSAKEQLKIAREQYQSGTNTILDVIAAQTNLFDARATYAQAQEEWFVSLATLTYSTGIIAKQPGEVPCIK